MKERLSAWHCAPPVSQVFMLFSCMLFLWPQYNMGGIGMLQSLLLEKGCPGYSVGDRAMFVLAHPIRKGLCG